MQSFRFNGTLRFNTLRTRTQIPLRRLYGDKSVSCRVGLRLVPCCIQFQVRAAFRVCFYLLFG